MNPTNPTAPLSLKPCAFKYLACVEAVGKPAQETSDFEGYTLSLG